MLAQQISISLAPRPTFVKSFKLIVLRVGDRVAQIDEQLSEASFGCCIITKDVREGGIS